MGKGFYHTKESVDEYIAMAKNVNGGELIEKLTSFLHANAKLLELGSGPGTDWKILNDSYKVIGSDNSSEFLSHLKETNPDGEFIKLDASELITEQKFEGIYSNKVLHHLTNDALTNSIERQAEILEENGIICHSFWKGIGDEDFKGMFVNYHDKSELISRFESQFDILLIESYDEFEADDSLLLIGRKK